ncbi:MAG: VWA domain-containing protein [Cytophagaceae bacterium]|nr:VWA domain-containing protein [Cytophagaceae bacterium]
MNWSREFSNTEIFYLLSFLAIYLIYFVRIFIISKKLKASANSSFLKFIIRGLYFGALSLALLGPSFGITEIEARSTAKDIYLAFDLSQSMNATDVAPSRLEKAKNEILGLIDRFQSDKIGLIIFNSEAQLVVPLTYDHESLKSNISNLKTTLLSSGSSDLNPVFELVLNKFSASRSPKNHIKNCLIVTDGEFFEPTDAQFINQLKANKINITIFAIGTQIGSKIPVINGFKKDKAGNEVVSVLDIQQIAEISKKTAGKYFVANNQKNELNGMIENILSIKSSEMDINQQTVTYNKYSYFLLVALLLIIIDFLLTVNVLKI